ncbi:MAG: TetR/AcrR family transcriptional regulator [Rhodobacteraceae bacterium]|nr:TetR/AcrR family transcriptional regulator [Paracoccaceae bacterium]
MKPAPRFRRGGPDLWIEAAYAILAQEGHAGLTIEQLTTRTGKTRGSFYHHFGSIDGFVSQLLVDWRERNTERIARLAERDPEPGARRTLFHREALRLDARVEIAIRNWAGTDRRVLGACSEVDRRRMDVLIRDLVALAERNGRELPPSEAEMLARIEYAAFVGAQMLAPEGKLDALPDIGRLYDEMLIVFLKHL